MRVVVNDKLREPFPVAEEADIEAYREEAKVTGSVMTREDATTAYVDQTRKLSFILFGVTLALTIGISLLAEPRDQPLVYGAVVVCNLGLALFLFLLLRRRISVWNAKLDTRVSGLAPAGTSIVVDDGGLEIGGRKLAWSSLRIDQVEVQGFSSRGTKRMRYFIQRMSLATSSDVVVLDVFMIRNGYLIVGNAWRRVRKARADRTT